MLNAIPSYNQHVMFLTGNADWPSKIEGVPGQSSKGNVVSALKKYLREDRLGNPNVNSLITLRAWIRDTKLLLILH